MAAKQKTNRGRKSLFGVKNVRAGGCRYVQGYLTKVGGEAFDDAALRLSQISGRPEESLSHSDVIEYLARGSVNTKLFLKGDVK